MRNILLAVYTVLSLGHCVQLGSKTRPNFIIILTDDQDLLFDSSSYMPNLQSMIVSQGMTFNNAFVATPICCPSRTELISGKYFQNIEVAQGGCMHVNSTREVFGNESLFQTFYNAGYKTGMFGKLTNDMADFFCNDEPSVQGFSRIHAPCNFNDYYGQPYFDKFDNGSTSLYNLPVVPSTYETSNVGNATMDWLRELYGNSSGRPSPYLLYIGPHAPHYPADMPVWYQDLFSTADAPRTPNFNVYSPDKHQMIAQNPAIEQNGFNFIDQLWRDRLCSLLPVDDMIGDIVNFLIGQGDLDNTYILYTSDNGYHLGQWRVPCSKQQMYDTDIRVPFFVRGPSIPPKSEQDIVVGNTDIAPTFFELAGFTIPPSVDGKSFADFLVGEESAEPWREMYLVQYRSTETLYFSHCQTWFPDVNNASNWLGIYHNPPATNSQGVYYYVDSQSSNNYRTLRIINSTSNIAYTEFVDYYAWNNVNDTQPVFIELYDMNADPYQMTNLYFTASVGLLDELHSMLNTYSKCQGASCP